MVGHSGIKVTPGEANVLFFRERFALADAEYRVVLESGARPRAALVRRGETALVGNHFEAAGGLLLKAPVVRPFDPRVSVCSANCDTGRTVSTTPRGTSPARETP